MLEKIRTCLDRNEDKIESISIIMLIISLLALAGMMVRAGGNEALTSLEAVIVVACLSMFVAALLMITVVKLVIWTTSLDRLKKVAVGFSAITCLALFIGTFATFNWWLLIGVAVSGAFTAYGFEKW